MGLYLTIFDGGEEVEGVEVGAYADFDDLRNSVATLLESGRAGERFPALNTHSDCDGKWTPEEASVLEKELMEIAAEFQKLPPRDIDCAWKKDVAELLGIRPKSLYDCFFDVDGEPLLDRLIQLARLSQARGLPILFQ